jgi:hypothetical protein
MFELNREEERGQRGEGKKSAFEPQRTQRTQRRTEESESQRTERIGNKRAIEPQRHRGHREEREGG